MISLSDRDFNVIKALRATVESAKDSTNERVTPDV
jgi:hypothetical protein